MSPRAVIFGCKGTSLSGWEADFFAKADPLGFILFARNCRDADQVRALVAELRKSVGRDDAPVLIDQEGGRVQRMKPPVWRDVPAPGVFGAIAERDRDGAAQAVRINARLLALELGALGINVDCLPLLDLRLPEQHQIIGDRAFSANPDLVSELGRACCQGLLEGGVLPVIKHIPGHGRALVDSHADLPRVATALVELQETDFKPFQALSDMPWGMTAHVVYEAVDPSAPATISPQVIDQVIRGWIGFDGLLVTDDLSMKALGGGLGERAAAALAAGCDVALHCNAVPKEMAAVAEAVGPLSAVAVERVERATSMVPKSSPAEPQALAGQLDELLQRA